MAHFTFIPGAGGEAWYWHPVVPLLKEAGHAASAVDLPAADEAAGLDEYADRVAQATGKREAIVVAHSLGGFIAPLVCERVRIRAIVFVNAMIPLPGETAKKWGETTGSERARKAAARKGGYSTSFEDATYFFHDVPKKLVKEAASHDTPQSEGVMRERCRFKSWPRVPIHVVVGRDDRMFPLDFQRRVARERLGIDIEEVRGGHLVMLSNPRGLVKLLLEAAKTA
jgi:pimeloyl-ACP methyl ester carboxylesterase